MAFADDELQALNRGLEFRVPITKEDCGTYFGEVECMHLVVPGDTIEDVKSRLSESIRAVILLRAERNEPFLWPKLSSSLPNTVEVATITITIRDRTSASSNETITSTSPQ